mmetsp:Transcript_40857/g.66236  ORF Transcript_40857/g.66236 Transcript_40857/m.66236 type:complete len:216 (+) Transcript_40857:47-694(+)
MKVSIFGATGGTGLWILKKCLSKGYFVRALVRSPDKLPAELRSDSETFKIIKGDVLNEYEVSKTVEDSDVVIVSLGGSVDICSKGQRVINSQIEKLKSNNFTIPRRMIIISSLGVGSSKKHLSMVTRTFIYLVIKAYIEDKDIQEKMVEEDMKALGTEYVFVRPGGLTDGTALGKYQAREDIGGGRIPREDVASFVLDKCLEGPEFVNKGVTIVS